MSTYIVKVEYSFLGIKYFRRFEVLGHFTEAAVGNVMIRPRLVLRLKDETWRVIPAIDTREFIVMGGKNGPESTVGVRGEQETEG
jgi:hypothetical protein